MQYAVHSVEPVVSGCQRAWPVVLSERRAAIITCTVRGETCTLLIVRHEDGRLAIYFHGASATSATLDPEQCAALIDALRHASA